MSKLFTYILNQRLSSWFEQSGAASQAQFAYKEKNSTADAVIVLSSVISHSLKKSNVFCAFIDFTKAFDSIDINLLYAKLMGYKISGKMLKMIVNIYSKVKIKVRTEGVISTGTFNLWMGLMQGECLSPSLFAMYINDIEDYFNKIYYAGITIEGRKICVLIYADDLILIAKSEDGLQKSLDSLYSYCARNKLNVNTSKSK